MDNLQIAEELHKQAIESWQKWHLDTDYGVVALAFELKSRLKKGVERGTQT